MNVELIRTYTDQNETIGNLIVRDDNDNILFQCDTLEHPFLNNQPNISSIPVGTYSCHYSWMEDAQRYHYEILNVPNRSGIFIHAGNVASDSKGCVLLGKLNVVADEDDLIDSRATVSAFENCLVKQDFQLTITNNTTTL